MQTREELLAVLTPDDAFDILTDSQLMAEFLRRTGMSRDEAKQFLNELEAKVDHSESAWRRAARAAAVNAQRPDWDALVGLFERGVRVPTRLRQVFELCVVRGRTRRQAADELGISVGTVRVHLRRLRALVARVEANARGVWRLG